MEPSKEAIAVRLTRLNRQILGKVTNNVNSYSKKTVDRETLLDALTVLFDECNEDGNKKCDDLVRRFLDKYRCALAELRRARVCLSDFEMLQMIGQGHFGEVHMVREKHTGDVYALKSLRKESAISRRGVACYEEERDVLAAGAAPWLVKLQYAFQDNSSLYLVMELCPGGDLAGLLSRRARPLSESDSSFYIAEVAHALRALHGLGYVHRDVKPQNILLDRCGHVKLCDFGSSSRLADGSAATVTVGTPDYVAPELLGATACDYWSLGVVAFELVTLRRPFTTSDEDSLAHTLSKIQSYERQAHPEPPFDPLPAGPSAEWRSLVAGLLRVQPSKRFHYLDTLQHPALKHLSPHSIRDQVPPWVPIVRGPEDASHFPEMCREPSPPDALPFRTRTPFAAHVPFIGFSYICPESNEEHSTTFSMSHDCTAIDMASYKSAEKLAASRGREVSRLQSRVAALEAEVAAHREETARAQIDGDTDKHALQKEITELSAANRRLERDVDAEREKRRIIERTNTELLNSAKERNNAELKAAYTKREELQCERNTLKEQLRTLETRVKDLEAECERANAAADLARKQQAHYKDIIEHVHELRHRRLTEINVRAIDSIAKERALRRQTLTGGTIEAKEAACKLAVAESNAMKESRAKLEAEKRLVELEHQNNTMKTELEQMSKQLEKAQVVSTDKLRRSETLSQDVIDLKTQLTQEKIKSATLNTQIQELQRSIEEASLREVAMEEQRARTESRLKERLEISETKIAEALTSDTRHREKVNILEHLVRQLEREVRALETRDTNSAKLEVISDTESNHDVETSNSQVVLLKEQLQKIETQLQARIEEVAALKQETRTANLEKWRKEREVTELTSEAKAAARDIKRLEDRVTAALEAKKTAVEKAKALQTELNALKPEAQAQKEELSLIKTKFTTVQKTNDTLEAEVDRSRNDIRKLKSELQYSEKRRIHAETQEELANRERAQLRDEAAELRASVNHLTENNKALQEACSLLEEQLTDLEKLADIHEVKNNDLESEVSRMREELNACRTRLADAEQSASEGRATAELLTRQGDNARELATHNQCQLNLLRERLESREVRISELEMQLCDCDSARGAAEGALTSAAARLRSLQEECAQLRTASHEQHALLLETRAQLGEAQEEIAAVRETSEAASAWWRTRETKADATLRQQAKLIDFLQAKVEEANRKKCSSLSNKLFGNKGRRTPVASPPLRKANRELREEVERLRARLANSDISYEQTPKRVQSVKKTNGLLSIDTPDGRKDSLMQLLWSDGRRENVTPRVDHGTLLLSRSGKSPMKAAVAYGTVVQTPSMTTDDLQRSINLKLENGATQSQVVAICNSVEERTKILRSLPPPRTLEYRPRNILRLKSAPNAALWLAEDAVALGCMDGLHSLQGAVRMACVEGDNKETAIVGVVAKVGSAAGRVVLLLDGRVLHVALTTFTSALKRAATLRPALKMHLANIADNKITLMETISGDSAEHACATVASGRRVFVLKYDASQSELKTARSFTIDKHPNALLLTRNHLYIAGERVLRVSMPSGALEPFATDDPTVAAAIRKHTPPKAMLLIQENPLEILICYNECGVFVDVNGKRTRSEDAKWSESVHTWCFVSPFLYAIGKDGVLISYINEEAYRLPPCTCDNHSMTSTSTECSAPRSLTIEIKKPTLLGCNSRGIIISSPLENEFGVFLIDGLSALRSIGASVESLDSIGVRNSMESSNTSQEVHDVDVSNEEAPTTGFLADIKKRATQLRNKQKNQADDVIKQILSKEVGPRRSINGRRSPATTSEFSTDSESDKADSAKTTDLCADMFARQVRFNS